MNIVSSCRYVCIAVWLVSEPRNFADREKNAFLLKSNGTINVLLFAGVLF